MPSEEPTDLKKEEAASDTSPLPEPTIQSPTPPEPSPAIEPQSEPEPAPMPEPTPEPPSPSTEEPVSAPAPPPDPIPEPAPVPAQPEPTPAPERKPAEAAEPPTAKEVPKADKPKEASVEEENAEPPEYGNGIPKKVLDLTPEELDAARRLWAKEHIGEAQKKANESRHKRMIERMSEIETYIKRHPNVTVHEISQEVNLSQKLTSGYLQKLVKAGRVEASGATNNRRFTV